MDWNPSGWRSLEARQQPAYDDPAALEAATRELAAYPALVGTEEVDALKRALAEAQAGRAFLLQGGDCAESFAEFSPDAIAGRVGLILAMAAGIAAASGLPVVRVGRIAGQFAKPRTADPEVRGETALPAYRGDIVNGLAFDAAARRADPERLFRAWAQSAATLSHVRALADAEDAPVYSSHEALLLPFEEALIRRDPAGRCYGSSGHLLWIGDRTRFVGSAHVEFARGLANPLGVKCGPSLDADTLLRLLDLLDPERESGRITLISRMGHDEIGRRLPPLLRAVRREGRPVLWCCDPMHGNTVETRSGFKTRPLDHVFAELSAFFAAAVAEGVFPGGIHVEMTGRDVAECTGGGVAEADLGARYDSHCDPRLNASQAMALAARAGRLLADRRARAAA
ncbi:MAG: 3-deoxy-7-phosphoheptulonate synthase [Sphingomonadales bacterium]|jgi:3-deoxy-7-phosphoheptulonate synthase|nr:3-deoxy-7-phosphoheptulonate synthase [Sphingomonadales bacterium]